MAELPLPEDLLRPRDRDPVIWVPAQTFVCPYCDPDGGHGSATTVEWLGKTDGPDGRCRVCGATFALAPWGDRVPPPEEQGWA